MQYFITSAASDLDNRDTDACTVEKLILLSIIVASEPGGNRNYIIKIDAQYNVHINAM